MRRPQSRIGEPQPCTDSEAPPPGLSAVARKGSRGPVPKTVLERVAALSYTTENGCRIWTGATTQKPRRPAIQTGSAVDGTRRPRPVHILVWEAHHGPVPNGYDVHHRCDNRMCVSVTCLELLEHAEHARLHANALDPGVLRERSQYAMHVRWHINRRTPNSDCRFCSGRGIRPRRPGAGSPGAPNGLALTDVECYRAVAL